MDDLHRRLLDIGFRAGDDLGLVLAGGYALAVHELVDRPSKDIDFATATALPLAEVAARARWTCSKKPSARPAE